MVFTESCLFVVFTDYRAKYIFERVDVSFSKTQITLNCTIDNLFKHIWVNPTAGSAFRNKMSYQFARKPLLQIAIGLALVCRIGPS